MKAAGASIITAARIGLVVLAPLVIVGWIAGYVSHFWQVGWMITAKPIEPSLEKLNPISGLKRIFGVRGLVKGGLDLGKTSIAFAVAAWVAWRMHDTLILLPQIPLQMGFVVIGKLMAELAFQIVAALLLLAILDYMFQRWKHSKDLRMSKQEVKDELKQSEGDPQAKRRRQMFARQVAMQRITSAVPTADVIVTIPSTSRLQSSTTSTRCMHRSSWRWEWITLLCASGNWQCRKACRSLNENHWQDSSMRPRASEKRSRLMPTPLWLRYSHTYTG